jgi:hypothetical protein
MIIIYKHNKTIYITDIEIHTRMTGRQYILQL